MDLVDDLLVKNKYCIANKRYFIFGYSTLISHLKVLLNLSIRDII